ncbi:MAG: VOC family protein [Actinomycetota bacterium]
MDEIATAARRAGARVVREPAPTFSGGDAGCFLDPDGHLWEIAHNPDFPLGADGSLTIPDFGTPASDD